MQGVAALNANMLQQLSSLSRRRATRGDNKTREKTKSPEKNFRGDYTAKS